MIDTVAGGSDDDQGQGQRLDTSTPLQSDRKARRKHREDKKVSVAPASDRTNKSGILGKPSTEIDK